MRTSRFHFLPLCSAHELRRDFRDVVLAASPIDDARVASLTANLPDGAFDAAWSHSPPEEWYAARDAMAASLPGIRGALLVARSASETVASELPADDPLGAYLRRLLGGGALLFLDHLLISFDDRRYRSVGWIGDWQETAALLERLARLANETVPVLVRGETGTGKEMIARSLHGLGPRFGKPFLAINCAELPESILESELFGHTRGAFTGAVADRAGLFEAAGDGTVFLDEIGELPLPAQAKLLRLLEEHCVRRVGSSQPRPLWCRIVAATNRNLPSELEARRFRADLFYRLRGSEIVLRPLRERRRDIIPLAELLAARAALRFRRSTLELAEETKLTLLSHAWPGNIRELRQTIDGAVLTATGSRLEARDLGLTPAADDAPPADEAPLQSARAVERAHILRALTSTAGNKMAAARILGLSRQSLERRMLRHGIVTPSTIGRPQTAVPFGSGGSRTR